MPNNDVNKTEAKYNMFTDLKTPTDLSKYTLFRGTTDFSQLQQFDLYESGYPYLVVVSIPKFLQKMATDNSVKALINSYVHVLEYEFKGLESGIDDLSTETGEISNGMQSMNVITKTTGISGTQFSMRYMEKSGSTLTKMHELYLRSVRDPATGFKTYNGLIGEAGSGAIYEPSVGSVESKGASTPSFQQECFSFLYMHTDNTGLALERAIYFVGCQPTSAGLSALYSGQKGEVSFQEVTCEFNGFPITGKAVNRRAAQILKHINEQTYRNSWDYEYAGIQDTTDGLANNKLDTPQIKYTERNEHGDPTVTPFLT